MEQYLTSGAYNVREMRMTGPPRLFPSFWTNWAKVQPQTASALESAVPPQPALLSRISLEGSRPRVMSDARVVAVDRGGKE